MEKIHRIENKLLVAVGTAKAKAVLGALRGGFADVLYIDEPLAKAVIALNEKKA